MSSFVAVEKLCHEVAILNIVVKILMRYGTQSRPSQGHNFEISYPCLSKAVRVPRELKGFVKISYMVAKQLPVP